MVEGLTLHHMVLVEDEATVTQEDEVEDVVEGKGTLAVEHLEDHNGEGVGVEVTQILPLLMSSRRLQSSPNPPMCHRKPN